MQVRCPQCHAPIDLDSDGQLSDIACPACGRSFSLRGTAETVAYESVTKTIGHFRLLDRVSVGTFGLSDFIQGVTLADRLTTQRFSVREAAELCAKIADAFHRAHESGVVHRDLKPGNIILGAKDEPHIRDFGLARREAGEVTMTVEGRGLGTPAYMSPEQAKGAAHTADRRSDVYSLGVILFEMLTGERPFRGNVRMLVSQVVNDEPPGPRRLNSSVPRDLETICLKCKLPTRAAS